MDMTAYLTTPLQLDKICRACLTEKSDMRPLFGACLDEMLVSFAGIEVNEHDGFPNLMCGQCVLLCSKAYTFKQQCEKSDNIVRQYLSSEFQEQLQNLSEDVNKAELHEVLQLTDLTETVIEEETIPTEHVNIGYADNNADFQEDVKVKEEIIEQNKYTCLKCDESFQLKVDLEVHIMDHLKEFEHVCHVCNKGFTEAWILKRHLKIHLDEKPQPCDQCDISFSESSNLGEHNKIHTGELNNIKRKTHVCSVCGKEFKWASSLSKHMRYHTGHKLATCEHCNKQFAEAKNLRIHLRTHTGEKPYVCNICQKSFTRASNLEKHLRAHTGKSPFLCSTCGKRFNSSYYLGVHMRTHTEEEFKCKICFQNLYTKEGLDSHLCKPVKIEHSNIENQKILTNCTVCDKICPDASSLSLHFLKHTFMLENVINVLNIDEEFIFCEICGQLFESNLNLEEHYTEEHNGKLAWACTLCSKVFEKEAELLIHNDTHSELDSNIADKNFQCVLCLGDFETKEAVLKHTIEHLKKKYTCRKCSLPFCTQFSYEAHLKCHFKGRFVCPTCNKILCTKAALNCHIIGVHSVQLLHSCHICSKQFATRYRLNIHLKIHSSTKQYACTYCEYSTHKSGDLKIHLRIHTQERPYKCTFLNCEMSFKTSSQLCGHVRRHLNVRKFKCTICSLAFSTNNELKTHHLQHSGERPHSCEVCEQTFKRKHHLTIHMKKHISKD